MQYTFMKCYGELISKAKNWKHCSPKTESDLA